MTYYNFYGAAFAAQSGVTNWMTTKPLVGGTLTGTSSADQMADVVGGASLVGGLGDDAYLISDSSTRIVEYAGQGTDSVTAYTNFRLPANVEMLTLQGDLITGVASSSGSLLSALGSRDVLVSGAGNDILVDRTTGKQNLFEFDTGSGKDSVYGFTATGTAHDLIRLDYAQYTNFSQLKPAMTQVGADVRIDLTSNDAILLHNVNESDLSAGDFLFDFSPSNLTMTFDDEFNSLSLDTAGTGAGTWKTSFPFGPANGSGSLAGRTLPANGELEVYVDSNYAGDPTRSTTSLGLNPFSVSNGVLSITATKLSATESSKLWGYDYASGLLTTEKSFAQTYGYFEIKADLPTQKGMWPAFWLLPTSKTWPPEIDIMESVSQNFASGGEIDPNSRDAFRTFFPDGLTGMHRYGLLWTEQTITWYVDGRAVGSVPTPASMHQPMYLLVNMAAGGDWPGSPESSFSSATMKVDYVHAYSLDQIGSTGLSASSSTTLSSSELNLTLTGTSAISGIGNSLDNVLTANNAGDHLSGYDGNDTLIGGTGSDSLLGGTGNDSLVGGSGNDTLDGGTGSDAMAGGAGSDTYSVDGSGDVISEAASSGYDRVISSVSYTLAANVEGLKLTGTASLSGTGNALANVIGGNAGNDTLSGLDGNDRLAGWNGNDSLLGGNGNDTLDGGNGNNILRGGAGVDTFVFSGTSGASHIADFGLNHEHDVIDLAAVIAAGQHPALSQTSVGAVITISAGYSVTLDGVDSSHLIHTSTGYAYDGY